jgi:hypothetical protein
MIIPPTQREVNLLRVSKILNEISVIQRIKGDSYILREKLETIEELENQLKEAVIRYKESLKK